jgi:cytidyltransferase-like protein|tara:strand:+ start:1783 stop:2148 length:366 start_codon:yes stop_codon:yes gene_type:complete
VINYKKPTAQMLGRFQPFHEGHFELFKKILERTGQVIIMVRDCNGKNNPYSYGTVKRKIIRRLREYRGMFEVVRVPNITNICYGRDVGYKIEEIKLSKQIEDISATKIRESENERPVDNKN